MINVLIVAFGTGCGFFRPTNEKKRVENKRAPATSGARFIMAFCFAPFIGIFT
jgi:hypothetical protein